MTMLFWRARQSPQMLTEAAGTVAYFSNPSAKSRQRGQKGKEAETRQRAGDT